MKRFVILLLALLVPLSTWAATGDSGARMITSSHQNIRMGADQYHLESGDKISIHVFGQSDLDLVVTLDDTGVINYPFLGKIHIDGLTVDELENKITAGLERGYLRSPQVNVSIVQYRPFFIDGEVQKPGAYPYLPGLTVLKAVSLAGGFTNTAVQNQFTLVREKTPNKQLTVGPGALVRPGDSITVGQSVFYIDGEVQKPGAYPYHPGLTLSQATTLAGGLTPRAGDIQITSKDGKEHDVGKEGMNTKIKLGDSIHVKQSFF